MSPETYGTSERTISFQISTHNAQHDIVSGKWCLPNPWNAIVVPIAVSIPALKVPVAPAIVHYSTRPLRWIVALDKIGRMDLPVVWVHSDPFPKRTKSMHESENKREKNVPPKRLANLLLKMMKTIRVYLIGFGAFSF